MRKKQILLQHLFFLLLFSLIFLVGCTTDNVPETDDATILHAFETRSTGSTAMGDVEIALTPLLDSNGMLNVELSANTHSVDLSQFPLSDLAFLMIDGQKIVPTLAPALQGHHAFGTLVFSLEEGGLADVPQFSIIIQGIPLIEERTFLWEVPQ